MLDVLEEVITRRAPLGGIEVFILFLALYCILIAGVFGNCIIIAIYIRSISMRNTPNTYIVSLSVANLLLLLIGIPLSSIMFVTKTWPFGDNLCKISIIAMDIPFAVSAFTFVLLSASRYFSIVNPLPGLELERETEVAVLLSWVIAAALSILDGLFGDPCPCSTVSDIYIKVNAIIKTLVLYLMPLLIITVLYIIMNKKLNERPKEVKRMAKIGKLLISMVLVFAVCLFPYHLSVLMSAFITNTDEDHHDWLWYIVKMVAICLSFGHACLNPVVVYYASNTFQEKINEIFARR